MVSPMACFQCAVGQTISMLSALTLPAMIFFFLRLLNLFILHFKLYCRLRINKTISIVVGYCSLQAIIDQLHKKTNQIRLVLL